MAEQQLPDRLLEAGRDYHSALIRCGLLPELTVWAYDDTEQQFVLVICTSVVDEAGPLALMRLLFRAYNMSLTPKEISPFILRLQSPQDHQMRELVQAMSGSSSMKSNIGITLPDGKQIMIVKPIKPYDLPIQVGDLHGYAVSVYHVATNREQRVDRAVQWRQFRQTVELAA